MPATNSRSLLNALKSFFKSQYCHDDILKLLPNDKSDIPNVLTFTL
ncbi:unnamed protein product, partial [Rotaria socialis]